MPATVKSIWPSMHDTEKRKKGIKPAAAECNRQPAFYTSICADLEKANARTTNSNPENKTSTQEQVGYLSY